MFWGILQAAGGLGLFLLGMSVMTDGLKSVADEKLRKILARSTKSPFSGVCTGAATTALIQSSSATTVAAVGLVHVGLLTFPESLGIIFGANVGTTITGWVVALLGFKLKLGEVILPVILVGSLIRLMGRGAVRSVGTAIAGFGLIFVGISGLQQGMAAFEGIITPQSFPPDTVLGRMLLVGIGVVVTLITQSSSAGVATALAAVSAGTISLNQAAAMVIGMDVGTTATAAMATIGGNIQARRTGFAHVVYNAMTALIAFLLLTPYFRAVTHFWPDAESANPEIALVSFHTFFNLLGVSLILPFTGRFARLIEHLFPEHGNQLTRRLDPSLLRSSDVALQAVQATLIETAHQILGLMIPVLRDPQIEIEPEELAEANEAIEQTRDFLDRLQIEPDRQTQLDQYTDLVHMLDHLQRITRRLQEQHRLSLIRDDDGLTGMTDLLLQTVEALKGSSLPVTEKVEQQIRENNHQLKLAMRRYRARLFADTGAGRMGTKLALQRMDAARSVRRIGYHLWRIADHESDGPFDRPI